MGVTDTVIELIATGEVSYDICNAMNGCLGGLVAITAGCSVIQPWTAVIVGVIGGWVHLAFSKLLVWLRIDDVVDAIPVHFANGIWGVVAVGLFADPILMEKAGYATEHIGWFFDANDPMLLLIELIQVGFILGWTLATMLPFFIILRCCNLFRADAEEEEIGLDISHHRGAGYALEEPAVEKSYDFVPVPESSPSPAAAPAPPAP